MNLNTKIRVRNSKLYVVYYEDKKRCVKSTKLDNTKQNKDFINRELIPKIMKSILDNKKIDLFENINNKNEKIFFYLKKVLEKIKNKKQSTYLCYQYFTKIFQNYLGNKKVSSITKQDIDLYIKKLEQQYKKSTIKLAIVPIKKALDMAYEDGLITKKIKFEIELKEDKAEKESLTKEQINLLLDNAQGVLKDYLHIALYTGLRISEILAIKWTDIEYTKNYIHIQRIFKYGQEQLPKNNKKWFCPINPKLKDYLSKLEKNNEFVINSTSQKINDLFKELQKKLNFEKSYSSHTLRHTFISQAIMAGLNPHYIKLFTGHKSVDMINNTYTHYQINLEEIEKYNKQISF